MSKNAFVRATENTIMDDWAKEELRLTACIEDLERRLAERELAVASLRQSLTVMQPEYELVKVQLAEAQAQYMDAAKRYVEKEGPEAAIRRGVRVWEVALWWRRQRDRILSTGGKGD